MKATQDNCTLTLWRLEPHSHRTTVRGFDGKFASSRWLLHQHSRARLRLKMLQHWTANMSRRQVNIQLSAEKPMLLHRTVCLFGLDSSADMGRAGADAAGHTLHHRGHSSSIGAGTGISWVQLLAARPSFYVALSGNISIQPKKDDGADFSHQHLLLGASKNDHISIELIRDFCLRITT